MTELESEGQGSNEGSNSGWQLWPETQFFLRRTVKVRVLSISPSPLSSSEPSISFSIRTESTAVFCFKLWAECTCLRFPDTYNPIEDGESRYWAGNQTRGSHFFLLSLHFCCPKQNKGNQCNRGNPAQTSTPPNSQPCAWRWAPNEDDQKSVNSLLTLCSLQDLLPYFLNLSFDPFLCTKTSALPIRTWDYYNYANPRRSINILK